MYTPHGYRDAVLSSGAIATCFPHAEPSCQRAPQVPRECERLEKAAHAYRELVEALCARLACVSAPFPPVPGEAIAKDEPLVDLAARLRATTARLDDGNAILGRLLELIEL